jgi:hypothetical protein
MEDSMHHCRVLGWILTAAVVLPVVGCAGSGDIGAPTAPTAPTAPASASTPEGRPTPLLTNAPFAGRDSGTFEFTQDACAAGLNPLRTHTAGTGTLIGAYSFDTQECFDTGHFTFAGTFTITAANGDTLVGAYTGSISGSLADGTSTYGFTGRVQGGTGRFDGATGTLSGTGRANLATFEESRVFSGTISAVRRRHS